MIIELKTTPQRVYLWEKQPSGTAIPADAPNTPNPADVTVVKDWLLGLTPHCYMCVNGVANDNGYTIEINVTVDEYNTRMDCSAIAETGAQPAPKISVPANVETALENIQSAAFG